MAVGPVEEYAGVGSTECGDEPKRQRNPNLRKIVDSLNLFFSHAAFEAFADQLLPALNARSGESKRMIEYGDWIHRATKARCPYAQFVVHNTQLEPTPDPSTDAP